MAEINGVAVPFIPIVGNDDVSAKNTSRESTSTFDSIFKEELEKVKFSNHAIKRLESRNIQLSDEVLQKSKVLLTRQNQKDRKILLL